MTSLISPLRVRLPFTIPLVLRYVLITLLLTSFVLGAWSAITPVAHAASHTAAAPKHAAHHTGSQPQATVTPRRSSGTAIPANVRLCTERRYICHPHFLIIHPSERTIFPVMTQEGL